MEQEDRKADAIAVDRAIRVADGKTGMQVCGALLLIGVALTVGASGSKKAA